MSKIARYSVVAIALHWLIAALIVLQVSLAGRMEGPPTPESFAVVQLHKSLGVTVLLLSLARLAWRLAHPPPPEPPTLSAWERTLARITHAAFYIVMIGMPLTGWIMVSTSRIVLPTLLFGVVPWPMIPGLPDLEPAVRAAWHEAGEIGHETIIKAAYVLATLHVAGALKHQLFSRDEPVLARMAPGAKPGRWLEPRLALILVLLAGAFAFGRLVQPPRPGFAPPPSAAGPGVEPVEAQAPAAPAADGDPIAWIVLPGSALGFETAWSGHPVHGRFDRWQADIRFSPDALERSRVSVSIDVASANTGSLQRDRTLPSADWLDGAAHPHATFAASRFTKVAEDRYVAHGALTLRGVTRPLDLPFRLSLQGDEARAQGAASLDRTAFGVGQGQFAGADQIPAKVTVTIDVKARRAAQASR